jgi:TPR repeat protein
MEGDGVPKDEEAARRYISRLESSTDVTQLFTLAMTLRSGWTGRFEIEESLHWYRRCADLGDVGSLEHLGLCYEKGVGVGIDLAEAVTFYERASELGGRAAQLSLGVFHWRGLGGFSVDRREAARLWRLGGLEIPDSALSRDDSISVPCSDSATRSSRFFSSNREPEASGNNRQMRDLLLLSDDVGRAQGDRSFGRADLPGASTALSAGIQSGSVDRDLPLPDSGGPARESEATGLDAGSRSASGVASESFALCTSAQMIDSLVLADSRSVRAFLGEGHQAGEIAALTGEGIRREGFRCLEVAFEGEEGQILGDEMIQCNTIESLLRLCAVFYTRDTFLYRRVNQFLRSGAEADRETGRNLGLYIGLLRECFCVSGGLSPLSWERPQVVYRGADFTADIVADYARRPHESIRWQGFASSSRDVRVALGFPGSVLFEISLVNPAPSLDDISAFKNEHEFILNPYQQFGLRRVRWDPDYARWIVYVQGQPTSGEGASWFVNSDASSEPGAKLE